MEIKKIDKESYESISPYLDTMLGITSTLSDLCFVDYNNRRYMLSIAEDGIAVVENDRGQLNPYFIDLTDPQKKAFSDECHAYEMTHDSEIKEVRRINNLTKQREILTFLPPVDNFPKAILEYRQIIGEGDAGLIFRYDVTSRKENLTSSIAYANYHSPDVLELRVLKQVLFFYLKKKYLYALGVDDNKYYEPLVTIGNLSIGSKSMIYEPEQLIKEIADYGFSDSIPEDLSSYLIGQNEDYKKLSLICREYQNYIKGQ